MAATPTVQIVNPHEPSEFLTINETEFDKDVHQLWKDPATTAASEEGKPRRGRPPKSAADSGE